LIMYHQKQKKVVSTQTQLKMLILKK